VLNTLDPILAVSASHFRAQEAGQISMFSSSAGAPIETIRLAATGTVPKRTMLDWEKELLGLYVSDHPLSAYLEELQNVVTHYSAELTEAANGLHVKVAGMVVHVRPFQTRRGKAMAFATIEDLQGSIELILFPSVWEKAKAVVADGAVVLVSGKAETGTGTPRVLAETITTDLKMNGAAPKKESSAGATAPAVSTPVIPSDPAPSAEEDWLPPPCDPLDEMGAVAPARIMEVTHIAAPLPQPVAASAEIKLPVSAPMLAPAVITASAPPLAGSAPFAVPPESKGDNPPAIAVTAPAIPATAAIPGSAAAKIDGPRLIVLFLRETGDRARDTRRLRILYGLLTSYPGADRFAFHISEAQRTYRLEFPANTTSWSPELERQVHQIVGNGCVEVQPWTVQ
jgi:DNA polymerase-3 subunit alpha